MNCQEILGGLPRGVSHFGTRTKLVYESNSMNNFLRGENEAFTSNDSTFSIPQEYIHSTKA